MSNPTTTVAIRSLPPGLARAIKHCAPKGRDVKIESRAEAVPSSYSSDARNNVNALVPNLDDASTVVTRVGVFGGDNGYNKAPADRSWDPCFDRERREVPLGGAIVVGQREGTVWIYVHPTTFAERYVTHDVARDALLEGRSDDASAILTEASGLSDEECAVLYAHSALKSGEYRRRVTTRFPAELEACVSRGLIKRSVNGSCSISLAAKAMRDVWNRRGENLVWKL